VPASARVEARVLADGLHSAVAALAESLVRTLFGAATQGKTAVCRVAWAGKTRSELNMWSCVYVWRRRHCSYLQSCAKVMHNLLLLPSRSAADGVCRSCEELLLCCFAS